MSTILVEGGSSIQAALNAANEGDIIQVKNGTYYERLTIPKNNLVLTVFPGHHPVIDGQNKSGHLIWGFNRSYIRISGLTIQNNIAGISYGIGFDGSSLTNACHHIRIDNNIIRNTGSSGINIRYGGRSQYVQGDEDFIIENNDLDNTNAWLEPYEGGLMVAWMESLDINQISNFVIRNNIVRHNIKEGISLGASRAGRCHNNEVVGKGPIYPGGNWSPSSASGGGTTGIYYACNSFECPDSQIEIFNNLIHGRTNGVVVASEQGRTMANVNVYNNIVYDCYFAYRIASYSSTGGLKKNIYFINNTAYNCTLGYDATSKVPYSGCVFRNNLTIKAGGFGGMTIAGIVADHNISSTDDPFVNAAGNDFHLKEKLLGSAVAAPTFDFEWKPRGTVPDIGAFEFGYPVHKVNVLTRVVGLGQVQTKHIEAGITGTSSSPYTIEVVVGDHIQWTAIPNAGNRFVGWSLSEVGGSIETVYEAVIQKDSIMTATFEPIPPGDPGDSGSGGGIPQDNMIGQAFTIIGGYLILDAIVSGLKK